MKKFQFSNPNPEKDKLLANKVIFELVKSAEENEYGKEKVEIFAFTDDNSKMDTGNYMETFLESYSKIISANGEMAPPAFYENIANVGIDLQNQINRDWIGIPEQKPFSCWTDAIIRYEKNGKVAYLPMRLPKNEDERVYETAYNGTIHAEPITAGLVELACSGSNLSNYIGQHHGAEGRQQIGMWSVGCQEMAELYHTVKSVGCVLGDKDFLSIID